jgi:TATA-binding protein-associated factor Taf7
MGTARKEAREQEEAASEEEMENATYEERKEAREEGEEKDEQDGKEEAEKKNDFSDISEEEIEHGMVSTKLYHHFFITFYILQDAALVEVGDVAGELAIAAWEIFPASPRGQTEIVSK